MKREGTDAHLDIRSQCAEQDAAEKINCAAQVISIATCRPEAERGRERVMRSHKTATGRQAPTVLMTGL